MSETRRGLLLAVAAFGFWGLAPIYFKALRHVAPLDILGHRVAWSVPLLAVLLTWRGEWPRVRALLADRRTLAALGATALLVGVNWLTFIHGVTSGQILETSLGYYINPLVNVALAVAILGERPRPAQLAAVALAGAGTLYLAAGLGRVPWIALTVAFTFGLYGLVRKVLGAEAVSGLFVETALLLPVALAYLGGLAAGGGGAFGRAGTGTTVLLAAAGLVTTLPLLAFVAAARRLPYTVLGLCQYLAPSLTFLLGVFVYGEPFSPAHRIAFGCIWTALAIFAADLLRATTPRPSGG